MAKSTAAQRVAYLLRSCAELSLNASFTVFEVLLLGEHHVVEGGEASKSGGTLEDSVLAVGGGNEFDLVTSGSQAQELLLETVGETFVHGGTTGEDDVLHEVLADVDVRAGDGSPGKMLDGLAGEAVEVGVEQKLRDSDTEGAWDLDHGVVGKSVSLVVD